MDRTRVVITGLGAITPLGSSVDQLWDGWLAGRSGVRRITGFDSSDFPSQIAGEIPDFNPEDYMERKESRRIPRSAQIALGAAAQAVKDAGLPEIMPDDERTGVIFGTAMGGIDRWDEGVKILRSQGYNKLNPFLIASGIPNVAAFVISRQFQCCGPNSTISTACATGTQTIGEAAEVIRRGNADVMIAGGTEAALRDYVFGCFSAMRALPTSYNDNPTAASRPFDARREGFVMSEGAGAVVLESLDYALARKARIYAEVAGQSSSADAFHLAMPDPDGRGPSRAMRWALADAAIEPEMVDYINAHGSSTPLNDAGETKAIKAVFGEHAYKLAVSSTKSMIGHAMGASGTLEAIACVLAITTGWVPPTINYEYPDPECDLDYVPNVKRRMDVSVALSNSFGLGGQNACLVLKKYQD